MPRKELQISAMKSRDSHPRLYTDLTPSHYLVTWIMLPFAVPVLIVVCCSVIQVMELYRRKMLRNSLAVSSNRYEISSSQSQRCVAVT